MKYHKIFFCLLVSYHVFLSGLAFGFQEIGPEEHSRIIVKITDPELLQAIKENKILFQTDTPFFNFIQKFHFTSIQKVCKRKKIQSFPNQTAKKISSRAENLDKIFNLAFPPKSDLNKIMMECRALQGVQYAEPNYKHVLFDTPNDPEYFRQWAHGKMQSEPAWDIDTGDENVIIAVIDTGVDYNHPDLLNNIWINSEETPNNGIDDDSNGYIDDVIGWDFVDSFDGADGEDFTIRDNDPIDFHGHGTHAAGIAGAVTDNNTGVAGTAWNCKIMAVRAGYKTPAGGGVLESDDAAQAIVYAAENGAKVINLSWGSPQRSFLIEDAIAFATSNGAIVCAASGNENSSSLFYPAALDNDAVVSIGATDSDDQKAFFSNYGDWVDVSAPGSSIYSTCLDDEYCYMSGTSMAAPYAAGLSALIFSRFPLFSPTDVKSRIMDTADYRESLEGGNATAGRINLFKALTDEVTGPVISSISPDAVHEGDSLTITGNDFGAIQDTGYVLFYPDKTAEIIEWSNTSILCSVPDGAQTGELKVFTSDAGSNGKQVIILPTYFDETLIVNDFLSAGEAQGWQADEQSWLYNLPFSFPFFGDFYESVYICSNGYIDFTSGSSSNQNSFESFKARAMIAPLWSNLITNGSSQPNEDIYIHSPSSDSICIRWKGESQADGTPVNIEVILHRNGGIQFNYGSGNSSLSPTIGVSRGDGEGYHLATYDRVESLNLVPSVLFTRVGNNMPPVTPSLLLPADGETEISQTPELQTAAFSDPDMGDTHEKTRWQISETNDFSTSVSDETSSSQLTLFAVPEGILNQGTSYYWRVKFYDNQGNESSWSEIFSFTTLYISPARIGGIVTVDGMPLTQASDYGYSFAVKKPGGFSYVPAAVDSDGLSSTGWYLIDIPLYDAVEQPGGAEPGDTGIIHVYRNGSELTILSPADGLFSIGDSGSVTQIDIQAMTPPVIYTNRPPVANAGPDQTVTENSTVTLDGSGSSDPDTGKNISYSWRQTRGGTVTLSDYSAPRPVFSAPDVGAEGGLLTFELTVMDSSNLTNTDTCIINITDIPAENLPPSANAGQDQTVKEGTTVELNGEASSDPDEGDEIASFLWVQTAGFPLVTLSDNTSSHPTFFTPSVDEIGASLTFQLTVEDPGRLKATDEVTITINDNQINEFPPDAVAFETPNGKNIGVTVDNGSIVQLNFIDQSTIDDMVNKPDDLIYGLINIKIKVNNPGDTAFATFYLPEAAPPGYNWYKYTRTGWVDFSAHTSQNAENDQITLALTDGGTGDDDEKEDSMIIDPSGLGNIVTAIPSGANGPDSGSSSGCFIGFSFQSNFCIPKQAP